MIVGLQVPRDRTVRERWNEWDERLHGPMERDNKEIRQEAEE